MALRSLWWQSEPAEYTRVVDIPALLALAQAQVLSGITKGAWILLGDLDHVCIDTGDDRDMAVAVEQGGREYQQIFGVRSLGAAVGELSHRPFFIQCAISEAGVEEAFGMSVGVWHAVTVALEVVAFDELHALIAKAEVVTILAQVSPLHGVDPAVVVDGDAIELIDSIAYRMLAVGVETGEGGMGCQGNQRQQHGQSQKAAWALVHRGLAVAGDIGAFRLHQRALRSISSISAKVFRCSAWEAYSPVISLADFPVRFSPLRASREKVITKRRPSSVR